METINGDVEVVKFDKATPIVLLNEIPLVPGHSECSGDYCWYDNEYTIIEFDFNLKPMDRISIIYRDNNHLPTDRINIVIGRHVAQNTKFRVGTLEVVQTEG